MDVDLEGSGVQEQDARTGTHAIFLSREVILLRCYLRHVHRVQRRRIRPRCCSASTLCIACVAIIRPYALFVKHRVDHHRVLSFNCPRAAWLTEVESDYAENLGSGMIAFAAFGAVGYSVVFCTGGTRTSRTSARSLVTNSSNRRKVSSVKLRVSKKCRQYVGYREETRAGEDTEVQQLKRTNTLSRMASRTASLNRTPTISKKAVRKQTRKTMMDRLHDHSRRFYHGGCVCGGVLRYRIRELYAIDSCELSSR